ncbi:MAG: hypothetical protein ACRDD1_02095, partial [Planctomycetia bacterium]
TIHTIVTKPINRLELIVGRILGFMGVFTLVLTVMGLVSVGYLYLQVSDNVRATQWTARVPIYAAPPVFRDPEENKLEVRDANGLASPLMFMKDGVRGIGGTNVGKEWSYRSHIEGETSDSASWYFNFDPTRLAGRENVRVEFQFDIFKTTKGDPTREGADKSGVFASLWFLDRASGVDLAKVFNDPNVKQQTLEDLRAKGQLYDVVLRVNNNRTNVIENVPIDVFNSGKVEVLAQCLTRNQFVGMAPADLYFLASEQGFVYNFFKGMVGLWLQVLLLTCVAVSASTVLKGFVTALFAVTIYILGVSYAFLLGIVYGVVKGGGPIEASIRLVTQNNQTTDLDPTIINRVAVFVDGGVLAFMEVVSRFVPDLSTLEMFSYVAEGFNIPEALLVRNVLIICGYVVPVVIVGYFFLKTREIATV